ncbi:hypothetical protein ACFQ7J_02270 [Streptomyces sp. NPDC056501]|uniref:hypothetical protein n=1 Tax=Streptomyces sp. NPDC056501 TaxID=3345841 RepID=UPI003676D718
MRRLLPHSTAWRTPPEQLTEDERLRALVMELSTEIYMHDFWATLGHAPEVVAARTALKIRPDVATAGAPAVTEAA